ncbi:MAG: recombinase family protein [Bacteroidia bacterium]
MKQRAILYTRVSTDEQNNGYSPADQKERLLKYCDQSNIEVVAFYHDDESGKTFNRPEWLNIMNYLKRNRGSVDLLIFIKWDRFSRNVAEAYITIRDLKKLGVEPQAIEQPLNFEIPEQKIMLAIYLAAPEVDNDRRALNIFHGIRRAKKEGRWIGTHVKGYKNARDEKNKPIMIPEGGKQEELIKMVFSEFATGLYNMEELRKKLNKQGLKSSRNAFWSLLRNKAYIGKIFLPTYKDEPAEWIEGLHEGIINEGIFYQVQDILTGRKNKNKPNKYSTVRDEMPLRGFLACPQCGRNLTGSASRGRRGDRFFYYHCSNGCKERRKAEDINDLVLTMMKKFRSNPQSLDLYADVLKKRLKTTSGENKTDAERISKDIEKNKQRLKNAQVLMLDGEINPTEYKEMKIKLEDDLGRLSSEEVKIKNNHGNYEKHIDTCVWIMKNLDKYYDVADTPTKQRIIGSIFDEKLVFEKDKCRTTLINEVAMQICRKERGSEGSKKRKHTFDSVLSCQVDPEGFEPSSKQGI